MADTPISGLTDGSPAVGTDVAVVARGASNRKLALSAIRTYMLATLHPVATSGSYNDLGDTPDIPATTTDLPEGDNLYYTDERVDARVTALLPSGAFVSTMSEGNTGTQNITAFAADLAAAYAGGESYYIPAGEYDFGYSDGTQVTIDLAVVRAVAIRGASGGRTKLKIPSGNSAIPLIFTALTTAAAYTPTAMATVTSGNLDNFTSLSTRSETTKLTFSGLPALAAPGRMISVVSNDLLPYAVTAYERNWFCRKFRF